MASDGPATTTTTTTETSQSGPERPLAEPAAAALAGMLPGLGYSLLAVSAALRVVDLAAQRIQATAALSLSRSVEGSPASSASGGGEVAAEDPATPLRFNARQFKITSVRVQRADEWVIASFVLFDYLLRLVDSNMARDLQSLSACLAGDLKASEEGELHITLPFPERPPTLIIEIEYELDCPTGVVYFAQSPVPHCFTQAGFATASELGAGCGLRCWLPCVDTLRARFDLSLALEVSRGHVALASGTLQDRIVKGATTVYRYTQLRCAPYAVGFVVGPFSRVEPPPDCPWVSCYALAATPDVGLLASLADAVRSWLDVQQLSSFAQVFVPSASCAEALSVFAGLSILSDAALLDGSEARTTPRLASLAHLMATSVAAQWLGLQALGPASAGDVWAPMGLAQVVALHAVDRVLGETYASTLVWLWTKRVNAANQRAASVLKPHARAGFCMARALSRVRPSSLPVDSVLWAAKGAQWDTCFGARAAIVARMLEQRATPVAFQQVLRNSVRVGMAKGCPLSELSLLSVMRARHVHDVDGNFVQQWLRHAFTPKFEGEVTYNAKHNRLEVSLRQISSSRVYMGAIRLRVVEEEGGAWEYVKQVDNVVHRWHLECRSRKPKGKGGRKKPFEEDLKLGRKFWENVSPVKYVLLDPEGAWYMDVQWTQPEEYWLELLHDPAMADNVRWLTFAVDHLARVQDSLRAHAALVDVVTSVKRPDIVRAHAASALAKVPNAATHLLAAYKAMYMRKQEHSVINLHTPGEAMVRPALLRAMAQVAHTSEALRDVLGDALLNSDNSTHVWDDAPVTAALAMVAGALGNEKFVEDALDFDRVAGGLASEGCLTALAQHFNRAVPSIIEKASPFPALRVAAIKGVIDVHIVGHQSKGAAWMRVVTWCLRAIATDPTPWAKRAMLKLLLSAHADTIDVFWKQIEADARARAGKEALSESVLTGEQSTAGCFWPLQNVTEDLNEDEKVAIRSLGDALWALINDAAPFDAPLRMLAHALWRAVWGTNIVGPLEREGELGPELGTLENWVDDSEREWERVELATMFNLRDIADISMQGKRLIEEREQSEKRNRVTEL